MPLKELSFSLGHALLKKFGFGNVCLYVVNVCEDAVNSCEYLVYSTACLPTVCVRVSTYRSMHMRPSILYTERKRQHIEGHCAR